VASPSRATDGTEEPLGPSADFELIQQVLQGQTAAFDGLVRRHQGAIFRLSYRMTRNFEDARDIAQETFVRAYQSLGSFRRQARFSTWLYRIAMNLCLTHRKALTREDFAEVDGQLPDAREDALTALLRDERERALTAAIEALPPRQRATLTLRVHEGLSHREIAEVLECAEGTAKANYSHAIRALQRTLVAFREGGWQERGRECVGATRADPPVDPRTPE